MKPTNRSNIDRRLSAIEEHPQATREEALCIRVVEVDVEGHEVTTQWETKECISPANGRPLVLHLPVTQGEGTQ